MTRVHEGETEAVLALGSNLGHRSVEIETAVAEIADTPGIRLLEFSPLVESAAVKLSGTDEHAPRYLNAVAIVATTLDAPALLHQTGRIENAHGRVRDERWGDRTLDIDIIRYGEQVSDDPALTLPHPRAAQRDFVLVPWLAVDPDAQLPGIGSVKAALERVGSTVRAWPREVG